MMDPKKSENDNLPLRQWPDIYQKYLSLAILCKVLAETTGQ